MFYETIACGHANVILFHFTTISVYTLILNLLEIFMYPTTRTPIHFLFNKIACLFDSLCPSQQFFSYVGTGLPRLNQY